jgi:hypothetical protein
LALAAGVAGAIVTVISKDTGTPVYRQIIRLSPVITIILGFYITVQLMLLTNYIYHTVIIMMHDSTYGNMTWASARKNVPNMVFPNKETWCFRKIAWFVQNFQPIVIYSSIVLGLILFITCQWEPCYAPLSSVAFIEKLAGCLFERVFFVTLAFLFWVHSNAQRFGEQMLANTEGRWEPPHADIAVKARQLWELNGKPDGRDKEFWFQAESELKKHPAPY